MSYNKDVVVDVPGSGKIFINQNLYVQYYTGYHWDNRKKKSVDDRVCIGKLVIPNVPDKMYPNEKYYELLDIQKPPLRTGTHLNCGPYFALYTAAEKIGVISSLKSAFPDLWGQILAICIRAIDDESSDAQNFEYWGFHNYCGLAAPVSSGTISKLYTSVSKRPDAVDDFFEMFREAFHGAVPEAGDGIVALDSTNRNTACKNNKYAEYGKAKVKQGKPITNLALMVDEVTGIILGYETYYGSILDKVETPITIEKIRELGYEKCHIAMDGGYASEDTVGSFGDGFTFSVMVPEGFNAYKQMLAEYQGKLPGVQKYYIPEHRVYGIRHDGLEIFGGKYTGYMFYDRDMAIQEENNLHEQIEALKVAAAGRKRYTKNMARKYSPWLIIEERPDPKTEKPFTISENTEWIQKELDGQGYFLVVSDKNTSPAEIIDITRKRDKSEKANKRIKSHFSTGAMHTHTTPTYEGKTFVTVVAQIIVEAYRWYIKDVLNDKTSETTQTTLGELRKYSMKRKKDGTWMPEYAMTAKQKLILSPLGITEESMKKWVRSITI